MQGQIAQMMGLALALNARVRGLDIGPFWPDAGIFRFCNSVTFLDPAPRFWRRTPRRIAGNPCQWLERPARGARIHLLPGEGPVAEHMSVALVGGGPRMILEVVGPAGLEWWEAGWRVRRGKADRIWEVTYVLQPRTIPVPQQADVTACLHAFAEILPGIRAFAVANDLGFLEPFDRAAAALQVDVPDLGWFADMVPPGAISLDGRRLLTVCQAAWIFGGMGSWNDIAIMDDALNAEYARWSARLFRCVMEGAVAVANSSFPD